MENKGILGVNFKRGCGEIFPIMINNKFEGYFVVTKCSIIKNAYILENSDITANIQKIVVNRIDFENRLEEAFNQRGAFVKLDENVCGNKKSLKNIKDNEWKYKSWALQHLGICFP